MSKVAVVNGIILVGLAAAGFATFKRVNESYEAAQLTLDQEKIRSQYLERAPFLRALPDEKVYQEQLRPFLSDYFSQVDEVVKNHHLNAQFDDFARTLQAREQGTAKETPNAPDLNAGRVLYEQVRRTWGPLRDGTYSPAFTTVDRGLRLDILAPEVRADAGGKIVFPVVVWGAQTELREDRGTRTQKVNALIGLDAAWKLFDAKGKLLGEMHMGDPSARVDYPERFIPFFPPQAVLGEYRIDRIPAEVAKIQLIVDATERSSWGSSQTASFQLSFPARREWQLSPGEAWQGAEVTERPAEELNPPKPSAAAAKK